jgi:hypothetical protein
VNDIFTDTDNPNYNIIPNSTVAPVLKYFVYISYYIKMVKAAQCSSGTQQVTEPPS